jgi:hypothetical protein
MSEDSDVNVPAIVGFGAGLTALALVASLVVWLLFVHLDRREMSVAPRRYPLAAGQQMRQPPEPRLQVAPRQDLQDFRRREDELLNNYRWVDKGAGIVRIPIAEAMKLVVQRGLPARADGEQK